MGHVRMSILPTSQKWRNIIQQIAEMHLSKPEIADIAQLAYGVKRGMVLDFVNYIASFLRSLRNGIWNISLKEKPQQLWVILTTARTQDQLIKELPRRHLNRISYYEFYCSLCETKQGEETQRTRAFLYTSIAYALSHALSQQEIFVYEN